MAEASQSERAGAGPHGRMERPAGAGPHGRMERPKEYVSWGASIRASHYLVLGAKARAVLDGRPHVSVMDVQSVAYPVLRHRILTNFHADSEGVDSEEIVKRLLEAVPTPKSGL